MRDGQAQQLAVITQVRMRTRVEKGMLVSMPVQLVSQGSRARAAADIKSRQVACKTARANTLSSRWTRGRDKDASFYGLLYFHFLPVLAVHYSHSLLNGFSGNGVSVCLEGPCDFDFIWYIAFSNSYLSFYLLNDYMPPIKKFIHCGVMFS